MKYNRITALLLVLLFIALQLPVFAAHQGGVLNEQELGLLYALDIIDESYNAEEEITRAELAELSVLVGGFDIVDEANKAAVFYDVTAENSYYAAIKIAAKSGIVSGNANGFFYPDNVATVGEAVKMFACAAGYGDYAEAKGGYPVGYFDAAQSMGLKIDWNDDKLTWGIAAKMAYDTLHAPAYVQVSFGQRITYEAKDNVTVLYNKHNIYHSSGIVDGVAYTTLTHPDSSIREGEITINGERFYYDNFSQYLGYYVNYYMKKDQEDVPELLYVGVVANETETLVIPSSDLISFNNDVLVYSPDGSNKDFKITFNEHPDLIYNGIAYPTYNDNEVIPDFGDLTLIDSDGNGNYDIIKVKSYTFLTIGAIDTVKNVIYDKYTNEELCLDENECNYTVLRGERKIVIQQLTEGQYLAVAKSRNTTGKPLVEVIAINKSVSGTIDSFDNISIDINYKNYIIGGPLEDMYNNGIVINTPSGLHRIKPGDSVKIFLFNNYAIACELNASSDYKFGYLINAQNDTSLGAKNRFMIASGKAVVEEIEGAEKVRIDGVPYNDTASVYTTLANSALLSNPDSSWPVAQPVRYKLNSQGQVSDIDTIYVSARDTSESLFKDSTYNGRTVTYVSANQSLYTSDWNLVSSLTADSKVIWVPVNDKSNYDMYNFTSAGTLFANYANYNVELLNVGDDFVADYAIVYLSVAQNVQVGAAPVPVVAINQTLIEDGEEATVLSVYNNGVVIDLIVSPDITMPNIAVGDLIRYRQNYNNEIYVITKVFDPSATIPANERIVSVDVDGSAPEYTHDYRTVYGSVWNRSGDIITLVNSISDDDGGIGSYSYIDNFSIKGNTYFYVYDRNNRKAEVSVATANDLLSFKNVGEEASRVFIYTRNGALNMVYIVM